MQQLVRHFKTPQLAIVDAVIVHTGLQSAGISRSEDAYISGEARIKQRESILWKMMVGPFGGCYSIRSDYFQPVPANFLVDDFYIVMRAVEAGGLAISDPESVCLEGATHSVEVEFKRKKRIGAGNFQNMAVFKPLWWPPRSGVGFAFFSHKIVRWVGPQLIVSGIFAALLLALAGNQFYTILLCFLGVLMLGIPLLDLVLQSIGIQILLFRGIRYFFLMHIALFAGWLYYLKGIRNNVWQPTPRS